MIAVGIWIARASRVARFLKREHPSTDVRSIHVRPNQVGLLSTLLPTLKLYGFEVRVPVKVDCTGIGFWSRTLPAVEVAHIPWGKVSNPITAESTPTTYGREAAVRITVQEGNQTVAYDLLFGSSYLWGIPRQFSRAMIEYAATLEELRTAGVDRACSK